MQDLRSHPTSAILGLTDPLLLFWVSWEQGTHFPSVFPTHLGALERPEVLSEAAAQSLGELKRVSILKPSWLVDFPCTTVAPVLGVQRHWPSIHHTSLPRHITCTHQRPSVIPFRPRLWERSSLQRLSWQPLSPWGMSCLCWQHLP